MTGFIMAQIDSYVDPEGKEFSQQTIWYKVTMGTDGLDIEIHREEPSMSFESRFEAMSIVNIDFFQGRVRLFPYDEHTPLEYEQDPITLVENVTKWKPIPEDGGGIRRVARFVQHGLNRGRGRKK